MLIIYLSPENNHNFFRTVLVSNDLIKSAIFLRDNYLNYFYSPTLISVFYLKKYPSKLGRIMQETVISFFRNSELYSNSQTYEVHNLSVLGIRDGDIQGLSSYQSLVTTHQSLSLNVSHDYEKRYRFC